MKQKEERSLEEIHRGIKRSSSLIINHFILMCTFYRSMNYLLISVRLKMLCWEPISIYFIFVLLTLCDILLSSLLYWSPALILLRIRDLCTHIRTFSNCLSTIPYLLLLRKNVYICLLFFNHSYFGYHDNFILTGHQSICLYSYNVFLDTMMWVQRYKCLHI